MNRNEKELVILKKYLPEGYAHFVQQLMVKYPIRFRIVKPRSTKLGDFKVNRLTKETQITINGNLNPYSFLITTVHEFAHYIAFKKYGLKIKPHGEEWKREYALLSSEAINFGHLPKDVEAAFVNSLIKIKASCSDLSLMRTLKQYDKTNSERVNIECLSKNAIFAYQNRQFKLLEKKRTRYLCEELESNKKYSFHALTEIELYEQ